MPSHLALSTRMAADLCPISRHSVRRTPALSATLTRERDKLLRAYYADAITLDHLKLEQDRIGTELSQIERQI